MSENMYIDTILDYYRNPRNFGKIKNPDISVRDVNPLCGDVVEISMKISGGKISDIMFTGSGCAISQAATSMLTEHAKGKSADEIKSMTKEEMLGMLGIDVSYSRIKCALLGLKVLKLALYSHGGQKMSEDDKRGF